jgi:serine/threonine-protein kinase RsbT
MLLFWLGVEEQHTTVPIMSETDIAIARIAGRGLAESVGFDTVQQHSIVISISELATNIFSYAGRGTITLKVVAGGGGAAGVEVVARDEGPGIADLDLALTDGASTNGGLGGGLPGVQRLMSEMEISSVVGEGTVVRATKWLNDGLLPAYGGSRRVAF